MFSERGMGLCWLWKVQMLVGEELLRITKELCILEKWEKVRTVCLLNCSMACCVVLSTTNIVDFSLVVFREVAGLGVPSRPF